MASMILHLEANPSAMNNMGDSPLHEAAQSGDFIMELKLLENGAFIEPK